MPQEDLTHTAEFGLLLGIKLSFSEHKQYFQLNH